jgi:hypothetical protein
VGVGEAQEHERRRLRLDLAVTPQDDAQLGFGQADLPILRSERARLNRARARTSGATDSSAPDSSRASAFSYTE